MRKVTSASSSSPHAPGERAETRRRVGVEGGGAPAVGDAERGWAGSGTVAAGGTAAGVGSGAGPGARPRRVAAWMVAFSLSNSSYHGGREEGGKGGLKMVQGFHGQVSCTWAAAAIPQKKEAGGAV